MSKVDKNKKYKSILVISDQHFPYNHPDIIAFLGAIKKEFSPDKIINVGDETDGNSISFHEKNSDLLSPSDELKLAINRMKPMREMFPDMDIMESNHGSLVYRRARYAGLPLRLIKDYNEILEAPKGWKWHEDLVIYASNDMPIYFCHGKSINSLRNSQLLGMSFVSGHHHSTFDIQYWANSFGLYWGMTVGCLIDHKSMAFDYGKNNLKKPIIGCAVILNGYPRLLPMVLDTNGRWIKRIV